MEALKSAWDKKSLIVAIRRVFEAQNSNILPAANQKYNSDEKVLIYS